MLATNDIERRFCGAGWRRSKSRAILNIEEKSGPLPELRA